MIMKYWALLFAFAASLIYGQTPGAPPASHSLICVEKMELPSYPALAQQGQISGTISVDVMLSTTGTIQNVSVQDESKTSMPARGVLVSAVSDAVRRAAFERSCAGRTVRLVFIFELAGVSDRPKQTVTFGSPNKFWIKSEAFSVQP
jgi:TonB family protein